jgi:hypothetical protein
MKTTNMRKYWIVIGLLSLSAMWVQYMIRAAIYAQDGQNGTGWTGTANAGANSTSASYSSGTWRAADTWEGWRDRNTGAWNETPGVKSGTSFSLARTWTWTLADYGYVDLTEQSGGGGGYAYAHVFD